MVLINVLPSTQFDTTQQCERTAFCVAVVLFIAWLRIVSFGERCAGVTLRPAFCFKRCVEPFRYFSVRACLGRGWGVVAGGSNLVESGSVKVGG